MFIQFDLSFTGIQVGTDLAGVFMDAIYMPSADFPAYPPR